MLAADTNVIVRIVTRDTPDQAEAADAFIKGGTWVATVAIMEATWVLATNYSLNRSELERMVEMLLEHEDLVMEDPHLLRTALAIFREKPTIQFSDALILATAKKAGHLPLGTFDRKLASRKGTVRL